MEVAGPDVVDMAFENKTASFMFIIPHSKVAIVSSCYEER